MTFQAGRLLAGAHRFVDPGGLLGKQLMSTVPYLEELSKLNQDELGTRGSSQRGPVLSRRNKGGFFMAIAADLKKVFGSEGRVVDLLADSQGTSGVE